MRQSLRSSLYALTAAVRFATLEIKFELLVRALERRYRPDQPRAPKGTREGGQWIDDLFSASQQALAATERIREAAGPKCDGFSGECQSGALLVQRGCLKLGMNLCKDCAVKFFSIEDLSGAEQLDYLGRLDKTYGCGGK